MSEITNPLIQHLRARIPGETYRLPSLGKFYNDGELDSEVVDGEVHVYPLTAIDEIILSTPDKLLNGTAIKDVFGRCIPQVTKPMNLLQNDVDFLLTCLRMISFGPLMEVKHRHTCKNANENTYSIDLDKMVKQVVYLDPTTTFESNFEFTMSTNQVVRFKPPVYSDVISFYQSLAVRKTASDDEDIDLQIYMFDLYTSMIGSVDGVTDKSIIREWIGVLSGDLLDEVATAIAASGKWGLEQTCTVNCKDCGEPIRLDANTNPIHFFI